MQALRFTPDGPATVGPELPPDPGGGIWCDLDRAEIAGEPTAAKAWLDGLHPLTLVALRRERPRHLESAQPSYVHIRLQVPGADRPWPVDIVVGDAFALTVGIRQCPATAHLWNAYRDGTRRAASVAFALYEVLSVVVDTMREQADRAAADAEAVAERLVRLSQKRILQDVVRVRRELQSARFLVAPAVDAFGLLGTRAKASGEHARPYLDDIHRQIREVLEVVDMARDAMGGAVEQYTSVQSTEMNRVMQVFTVVAVLFMPATLVASIYGMNFHIPEYHWHLGYQWALGLMLVISATLYAIMRARRWL